MKFPRSAVLLRNLIIISFLCVSPGLFAQSLLFHQFSIGNGLPSSEVYDVLQDKKGFIWIATDRGVCRYDGYRFRQFNSDAGLTDNTVFELFEDDRGRIWCCPMNGKVCYISNDSIYLYRWNDSLAKHLQSNRVFRSIHISKDEVVTFGTMNGILRIDQNGKVSSTYDDEFSRYQAVVSDEQGYLMAGRTANVLPVPTGNLWVSMHLFGKADTIMLNTISIRQDISVFKRRNGNVVFNVHNALVEIKPSGEKSRIYFSSAILRISETSDSCLWISLGSGGVYRSAPNKVPDIKTGEKYFGGETISDVVSDHENGIWISSLQNGLHYIPHFAYRVFLNNSVDPVHNDVSAVCGDGDNVIYAGMRDGFIMKGDGRSWTEIRRGDPIITVKNIHYDQQEKALYVSQINPVKIQGEKIQLLTGSTHSYSLAVAGDSLLVGNTNFVGVYRNTKLVRQIISSTGAFRAERMLRMKNGKIWAGGLEGLYQLQDTIFVPKHLHPALTSRVSDLLEYENGKLLVSTLGKGLVIVDGNSVRQITVINGLASSVVNAIAVDSAKRIWIGTTRGISCVTFTGDTFSVRNYFTSLTSDIRDLWVQHNVVWIATASGLVAFSPERIKYNSVPPPVYLTEVSAAGKKVNPAAEGKFSYTDNALQISFTGLTYQNPGRVRYRYRLLGGDTSWSIISSNNVQLASLQPGDYVFEVAAFNDDGLLSIRPARYVFSVLPPFWRTWWFLVLLLATVFGLLWLLISYRIRQIREQNRLRIRSVEYQQQALAGQMNPHFIFNALNSIQSYLVTEDRTRAMKYLSRFARLMRIGLNHSRENFVLIDNEMELIRLYLELETMRFEDKVSWSTEVSPELSKNEIMIPSMLIQPIVENAVRHGLLNKTDGGKVTVKLFLQNNQVHCIVDDDGVGRAATIRKEKKDHKSVGTSITVDRLKLICSTNRQEFFYEVTDKKTETGEAAGTTVHFILPFIKNTGNENSDR